jgi:hypothetical protein
MDEEEEEEEEGMEKLSSARTFQKRDIRGCDQIDITCRVRNQKLHIQRHTLILPKVHE